MPVVMQLADWLFMLLLLRSDDPHGRSAVDIAQPPRPDPAPGPARDPDVLPQRRPLRRASRDRV
jgi:hypothetical protein